MMKPILSPVAKLQAVQFENFLDCCIMLHKYKPADHDKLKLKAFAYIVDSEGKVLIFAQGIGSAQQVRHHQINILRVSE